MANVPFDRRPVADAGSLGIDPVALQDLFDRVQNDVDTGILPSCQLAMARNGRVAVRRAFGGPPVESRYVMFSATKAVVAGAVWILMGEGLLDVTLPVAALIPEFAPNGKDEITVAQVMLHTSGFPRAPFAALDWDDRDRRLQRFSSWRLNWEPGTRYEYHPTSAHWVLAEIIERCSGTDFREFVRGQILDRLGLAALQIGVPAEHQGDINDLVLTGEPTSPDELEAAIGVRALPLSEVTADALMTFNRPEVRAVGVPGGGGVTDAADLCLYYQALLHDPAGIWKPEVLADVTADVRNDLPDYLGTPANRSLGLVIAGDDGRSAAARNGPHRVGRARSGTTARAARSPGLIPRPVCRSVISRTGSTRTSCANGAARPGSRAVPRSA